MSSSIEVWALLVSSLSPDDGFSSSEQSPDVHFSISELLDCLYYPFHKNYLVSLFPFLSSGKIWEAVNSWYCSVSQWVMMNDTDGRFGVCSPEPLRHRCFSKSLLKLTKLSNVQKLGLRQLCREKESPSISDPPPLDRAGNNCRSSLSGGMATLCSPAGALDLQLDTLKHPKRSVSSPSCTGVGEFISSIYPALTLILLLPLGYHSHAKDCHCSLD